MTRAVEEAGESAATHRVRLDADWIWQRAGVLAGPAGSVHGLRSLGGNAALVRGSLLDPDPLGSEVSLDQSAWHGTCFSAVLPSQVIVALPVCI
jgi:hypothetical protein